MSHGGVEFVGAWGRGERRIVERTVAAVDEYVGAHMPRPWVFARDDVGFSVEQPSLFDGRLTRAKLGDLLEAIRHETAKAAPWVTYSE